MKKIGVFEILKNSKIVDNIYDMVFKAPELSKDALAGQFLEIYIDNNENILPRPISICEVIDDCIRIVYAVVGKGTKTLSQFKVGEKIRVLGNCGNGYKLEDKNTSILVGGGVGIPPLLETAKRLTGKKIAVLGMRTNTILVKDFKKFVDEVYFTTDDGSFGYKGNVVQLMEKENIQGDIIYSCGPYNMLKGVSKYAELKNITCQVSMEERMACGLGSCVCCVLKVKDFQKNVYKKICKDGPVFDSKEVVWI